MNFRDNGDIESEISKGEEYSSEEVPYEGGLLMVRRLISSFIEDNQFQNENIFHLRYMIQGKCCSLIIDGGSTVNVASQRLVEKLCFHTIPHPKPYKLQLLSEKGEMDKYKDEIFCDVVPIEAIYVILERPSQFDRKVIPNGVTSKFSFVYKGNKVTLKPLTLRRVIEDQITMEKREEKKEKIKSERSKIKKDMKNQNESILVSRKSIKNVLLNKKEPLLLLPTNMYLVLNSPLENLLDIFSKKMPRGLPTVKGIEKEIDFMPGAHYQC
ncbi:hypothetical protein CR513_50550, partial [Mucuna pruriens]